jgi:hypothetical protein
MTSRPVKMGRQKNRSGQADDGREAGSEISKNRCSDDQAAIVVLTYRR